MQELEENGDDDEHDAQELPNSKLRGILYSIEAAIRSINRKMNMAQQPQDANKKKCWEVYVGHGRTTRELARMGADTETFSPETGWD